MMTEQQKRVIRENPHLQSGKLASFLGVSRKAVESFKRRQNLNKWSYTGINIPYCKFHKDNLDYTVSYKHKTIFSGCFKSAMSVLDHLIWCIENGIFKKARIEHPYFENIKL